VKVMNGLVVVAAVHVQVTVSAMMHV